MTGECWDPAAPGVMRLPSGRLVRGRPLSRPEPGGPPPAFGVYLLGRPPPEIAWEWRWLRWPDLRRPSDLDQARSTLAEAWRRAATERVELACTGGRGRRRRDNEGSWPVGHPADEPAVPVTS
ncbi:MAG TPA: hypothetical protein VGD68_12450 [Streptosporangiaceae bacterium]